MNSLRPWQVITSLLPLVLGAGQVAAEGPEVARLADWEINKDSTLVPGSRPGRFILATNARMARFSYGNIFYKGTVGDAFELELEWRRITGDGHYSMEIHLPGAVFLFRNEEYGLYATEAQWRGYRKRPGLRTELSHRIRIEKNGLDVKIWVDGKALDEWRLQTVPKNARVGVALKGPIGTRSKLVFSDFRLTSR